MVDVTEVRLSQEERRFLLDRCTLARQWISLLGGGESGARTYTLSKPQIDELREQIVTCLQTIGFDETWEANARGRLLEGIIDKLAPRRLG